MLLAFDFDFAYAFGGPQSALTQPAVGWPRLRIRRVVSGNGGEALRLRSNKYYCCHKLELLATNKVNERQVPKAQG